MMLVLSCGLGWLAHEVQRALVQREAVATIAKRGAVVVWEPESGDMTKTAVAWLGKLLGEDLSGDLFCIAFTAKVQVNDAELEQLQRLTQLRSLYLDSTRVTDAGLENLRGLTRLQTADLRNTQVTEAGLTRLQKALPNCKITR